MTTLVFAGTTVGASTTAASVLLTNAGEQVLDIQSALMSDTTDFKLETTCAPTLQAGASCTYTVAFVPQKSASLSATLTLTDNSGGVSGTEQAVHLSGTGTPIPLPQAALGPASVSLGSSVLHSASAAQTVTLSNPGNAPLAISSSVLSDPADFAVASSTCQESLAAGASCAYSLLFTPQTPGALTGTFLVTDDANGIEGSQQNVTLSGTGLPIPVAQLQLSTSSLSFASTVLKTSASPQTLTLSNLGNAVLTIAGMSLADTADYSLASTCGATLAAGASCAVTITFSPQTTGPLPSALTLTDSSGLPSGVGQQIVVLSGTGLPVPMPQASVTPTTVLFGAVPIGSTSAPQVLTLQNTGTAALVVSALTLSDTTNFVLTNGCGASLAAGSSCPLTVTFAPQKTGALSATITLTDNSAGAVAAQQVLAVSGTGAPLAAPLAGLTPSTLNFPDTMASLSSAAQTVTLSNGGNAPLAILSVVLSDTTNFSLASNCPASLASGSSCSLTLVFQPQAVGAIRATLTIADNSGATTANPGANTQQTAVLLANGIVFAEPRAVVSPSSLTFPKTIAGSSAAPQSVTLTNTGTQPLHVASAALSGTASAAFSLSSGSCVGTLAAGASCTVDVTYSPTLGSADDTAALVFTDDALGMDGTTQTVALTGSATEKVDSVENFGDSLTCGFYAQPQDGTGLVYSLEGYAGLFDASLGVPATNWCRQGDTAADLSRMWVPWNSTPTSTGNQLFTMLIGTNDAYRYGIPQSSLQTYTQEVGAAVAWLAIPNGDKVLANAITQQNGTWMPDVGFGMMSTDSGASLTFSVNQPVAGRNLYVVYHVWALPYGQAGKATIAVDGTVQATVEESQNALVNVPTQNGTADTFLVQTVPLGEVGPHTVTFSSAGPGGSSVGLLWAGVPQQDYRTVAGAPRVMVGLITNSPSGNQTFAADIYNLQLKSLVPSLAADGMSVDIVPTDRVLDPGSDFVDLLHPNNTGHAKLAATFEQYR